MIIVSLKLFVFDFSKISNTDSVTKFATAYHTAMFCTPDGAMDPTFQFILDPSSFNLENRV